MLGFKELYVLKYPKNSRGSWSRKTYDFGRKTTLYINLPSPTWEGMWKSICTYRETSKIDPLAII